MSRNLPGLAPGYKLFKRPAESKRNKLARFSEKGVPPIGIALTMPKKFFENRKMTEEQFIPLFEKWLSEDDHNWYFKKSSLPTQDFAYVYIVFGGKVQFKANLLGFEKNKEMDFKDSTDGRVRHFDATNWIVLCGPAQRAPVEIPCSGFQGFRYVTKELW